jgi:hypothetical protein
MEHSDTQAQLRRLKRHLYIIFWEWVQRHSGKLISGAAGLFSGIILGYIAIWTQLHEAHAAAADAKSATDRLTVSISNLATRDSVAAVKEKCDELWLWREAVYDKAELDPHAKLMERRK